MAQHIWSILCTRTIVDERTHNVTIVDVIEQLNIESPPPQTGPITMIPINYEIVSLWMRDRPEVAEDKDARLKCVLPNGQTVTAVPFKITLTNLRYRTVASANGLPFVGAGIYSFEIEVRESEGWKSVARLPLQVVIGATAQGQVPEPPSGGISSA
jgi:hypothetical protein